MVRTYKVRVSEHAAVLLYVASAGGEIRGCYQHACAEGGAGESSDDALGSRTAPRPLLPEYLTRSGLLAPFALPLATTRYTSAPPPDESTWEMLHVPWGDARILGEPDWGDVMSAPIEADVSTGAPVLINIFEFFRLDNKLLVEVP